jgi:hypothetical protein
MTGDDVLAKGGVGRVGDELGGRGLVRRGQIDG